jgi:AAA domain-containing protein
MEPGDAGALLAAIEAQVPAHLLVDENPALLLFDTMARCMIGGDENSVQDVGRVIASVDAIRRRVNASVLLIHHTGKQNELERGSSALRGAADTMFLLHPDDSVLVLETTKQRDAPAGPPLRLRLVPHGGSCLLEPDEGQIPAAELTVSQRRVLETIRDVQQDGWAATSTIVRNAQGPGTGERTAYAALRDLTERGYVEKKAKRYALTLRAQGVLGTATRRVAVSAEP